MANISESELLTAIQSAESGAFFRDEIPQTNAEESITWLEHIESQYKRKSAAAPKGAEKARLVIRRESQTKEILKHIPKTKLTLDTLRAWKLRELYVGTLKRQSPSRRAELYGISENEFIDLETGEVRPKFVAEVEKNHFVSPVYSLNCAHDKQRPANKKPKIVTANNQKNRVHFQSRNWSSEYRVVCTQMTKASDAPDSTTGDRVTNELTSSARGKVIDSGLYMQAVKGGYTTFCTPTMNAQARYRLDNNHYRKVRVYKESVTHIPAVLDSDGVVIFEEIKTSSTFTLVCRDNGKYKKEREYKKSSVVLDAVYTAEGELLHDEIETELAFTKVEFTRTTIGQELSPFLDLIGKMHKRGWTATGILSYTHELGVTPEGRTYYATNGKPYRIECIGKNDRLYPWGKVSSQPTHSRYYPWGRVDSIGQNDVLYPWGKVSSFGAAGRVTSCSSLERKAKKYPWGVVRSNGAEGFRKENVTHNTQRLYDWGVVECIEHTDCREYAWGYVECIQDENRKPVFDYMWIAEAPRTEHGEREYDWGSDGPTKIKSVGHQNYHAHMLMRWDVEPMFFHEWAKIIEEKWGNGFFKLERIHSPAAASNYLLKAVGYMTKGSEGSQGEIRGNRYNISRYARAEKWENCATHESQHMFGLIQEYKEGLELRRKRRNIAENKSKKLVADVAKLKNINKKTPTEKRAEFIKQLEQKQTRLTNKLKTLSGELHGNFARGGVAKFANAVEFKKFLDFAVGVRGWKLKTVFSRECSREHIKQQRAEENAVTKMLVNTQRVVDESIESVMAWYSRFELVTPDDDEYYNTSLVTGGLCAN